MEAATAYTIKEALKAAYSANILMEQGQYYLHSYYFLTDDDPSGAHFLSFLTDNWPADRIALLENQAVALAPDQTRIAESFYSIAYQADGPGASGEAAEEQPAAPAEQPQPLTYEQIIAQVRTEAQQILDGERPVVEDIVRSGVSSGRAGTDTVSQALAYVRYARRLIQEFTTAAGAAPNRDDTEQLNRSAKKHYQSSRTPREVLTGDAAVRMVLEAAQKVAARNQARIAMAQQGGLAEMFRVTPDDISRGCISMGEEGPYTAAQCPVIWTRSLGGCQGVFIYDGAWAYGSHLAPGLNFSAGTVRAKAHALLGGRTGARVTLVSASVDVGYAQEFVREFMALGVPRGSITTVASDRVAMDLRDGRVVTAFADPGSGQGGTGAGGAYQDVQGW
jgi:hypothetical protein